MALISIDFTKGNALRAALYPILLILLSACFATKPAYKDPPEAKGDDVLVMLFRPSTETNANIDSNFFLNNEKVVTLSGDEYTWFLVPAGKYTLRHEWVDNSSNVLSMSIYMQKNKVYLYQLSSTNLNGVITWNILAGRVDENAMSSIRDGRFRDPSPNAITH